MTSIHLIKDPLDYRIPIFDDFSELFKVFAQYNANVSELYDKNNSSAIISRDGFSFDDDTVLPYFYFFLVKYFDKNVQHKDLVDGEWFIRDEEFNHYGWNYYTYDSIHLMIQEIQNTIQIIDKDFDHPQLAEFRALLRRLKIDYEFMGHFYPKLKSKFEFLPIDEQDDFIFEHLDIIIDLYERFIDKLIKLMDNNPNCRFICFCGP